MSIAAIITAILQIFGPLLAELFKKWLDNRLNKAAKALYGDNLMISGAVETVTPELIRKAIEMTPRAQVVRRLILNHLLAHAATAIKAGKLTAAEKKEFETLARIKA